MVRHSRIFETAIILIAILGSMAYAGLIVGSSGEAYSGVGNIQGIVTTQTGDRLVGIKIILLSPQCAKLDSLVTSINGEFSANFPQGSYYLTAESDGYVKEFYSDAYLVGEASLINIYPKQENHIRIILNPGSSISGIIRTAEAEVKPLLVSAVKIDNPHNGWEKDEVFHVGLYENYELSGLLPGYYKVFVRGLGYQTQYYPQAQTFEDAGLVNVTESGNTENIDFDLTRPGSGFISGQMINLGTGLPISGISIYAYQWNSFSNDPNQVSVITDLSGRYQMELTAGYYKLVAANIATQNDVNNFRIFYDQRFNEELADVVYLGAGESIRNINFGIDLSVGHGLQIAGSVSGNQDGRALQGVRLLALEQETGRAVSVGTTGSDGSFVVGNLCDGAYLLEMSGANIVPAYWPGVLGWQQAQPVVLCGRSIEVYNGGAITQDYGTPGLTISGHVEGPSGPLENVRVFAINIGNDLVAFAKTDIFGNYEISSGLGEGSYSMLADLYLYDQTSNPGIVTLDLIHNAHAQNIDFNLVRSTQDIKTANVLPDKIVLLGNYPNPFNSGTMISFMANSISQSEIRIYDLAGRLCRSVMANVRPGINSVYWDGRNNGGNVAATGVYFYRIKDLVETRKMLLIK